MTGLTQFNFHGHGVRTLADEHGALLDATPTLKAVGA